MYLYGDEDDYNDDNDDYGHDQPIIDPAVHAMHQHQSIEDHGSLHCISTPSDQVEDQLMMPPTPAQSPRTPTVLSEAKKYVIDNLECVVSCSSSSNFIVSTSPLCSTFKLPERAYGDATELQSIRWDLAEDTDYESKTCLELIAELHQTCSEF